jgi:hypothetical protein
VRACATGTEKEIDGEAVSNWQDPSNRGPARAFPIPHPKRVTLHAQVSLWTRTPRRVAEGVAREIGSECKTCLDSKSQVPLGFDGPARTTDPRGVRLSACPTELPRRDRSRDRGLGPVCRSVGRRRENCSSRFAEEAAQRAGAWEGGTGVSHRLYFLCGLRDLRRAAAGRKLDGVAEMSSVAMCSRPRRRTLPCRTA